MSWWELMDTYDEPLDLDGDHPNGEDFDYAEYVLACERENLEHHDQHMWRVHGKPKGPV